MPTIHSSRVVRRAVGIHQLNNGKSVNRKKGGISIKALFVCEALKVSIIFF